MTLNPQIKGTRFTEKYLQTRYNSSQYRTSASSPYPALPPRSSAAASPSSPPRKVVSEFKAFAASTNLSMAQTPLGESVESDLVDEASGIELKFSSISLDQAKRITSECFSTLRTEGALQW